MRLIKERIPVTSLLDEFIDLIVTTSFPSPSLTLSTMILIERYKEKGITTEEISNILQVPELYIEGALITLTRIGYLSKI